MLGKLEYMLMVFLLGLRITIVRTEIYPKPQSNE